MRPSVGARPRSATTTGSLSVSSRPAVADGVGHGRRGVGDDRHVEVHRFEHRHVEALVLGEAAGTRRRCGSTPCSSRVAHDVGERDRVGDAEVLGAACAAPASRDRRSGRRRA